MNYELHNQKSKWKNRFANLITGLCFIIMAVIILTLLTMAYFKIGNKTERATLTLKTVTQMTMPNVFTSGLNSSTNTFFNVDIDGQLLKLVGKEMQTIGELDGKMFLNRLNVNRQWVNGSYKDPLYFVNTKLDADTETHNQAWQTLEVLSEGTVSEVALTFDHDYTFDEVFNLFQDYDIKIAWYAIQTGIITEREHPFINIGNGAIGFHDWALFDFSTERMSTIADNDGLKREQAFKTAIAFLGDNANYVQQYAWWLDEKDRDFKQQLAYVNEHGVNIYGVIVTGPTKELLKLKEITTIHSAVLGEVDFWNWTMTGAGSEFYN